MAHQRSATTAVIILLIAPTVAAILGAASAAPAAAPAPLRTSPADAAEDVRSGALRETLAADLSAALARRDALLQGSQASGAPTLRAPPSLRDVAAAPFPGDGASGALRVWTPRAPSSKPLPGGPLAAEPGASPEPETASMRSSALVAEPPAATQYVIGFTTLPSVQPGGKFNGDVVLSADAALRLLVLASEDVPASLARAQGIEGVEFAEADPVLPWVELAPDDPLAGDQWSIRETRLDVAWDTTTGSTDAAVCIIDSGVRIAHEDLGFTRYLGGHDFVEGDADPDDDNGHGTHVAGIAVATVGNATGIAGAGNVGWYAVKALDASGGGSPSQVAAAVQWCVDNTIQNTIISLSLGQQVSSFALRRAIENALASGRLVVAAAGNDGPCSNCIGYPARYDGVIAVTCTNDEGMLCGFSSVGPQALVAAPGQAILSANAFDPAGYLALSGTSMSAPLVSGALALAWSHAPALTDDELRARFEASLVDRGAPGRDAAFGLGTLDAACLLAASAPCLDALAPVFRRAAFDRDAVLVVRFSEPLDATAPVAPEAFAVLAGDASLAVASVLVEGSSARLTLAQHPPVDLDISVQLLGPGVRDLAGNEAAPFAPEPVDTTFLPPIAQEAGGPDLGGYVFRSSLLSDGPAPAWVAPGPSSTYLWLSDDDVSRPIELPFPFSYYGDSHERLFVSSNGFLTFLDEGDNGCCDGDLIPGAWSPNAVIAPLWNDIDPSEGGTISYQTVGAPGSRVFIVTWDQVPNYGDAQTNTFQVKLFEADHAIEFHYVEVSSDLRGWSDTTIGIENATGGTGLQYFHGDLWIGERALRFEPTLAVLAARIMPSLASGLVGEEIAFAALLAEGAEAATWSWSFGEGATSGEATPRHVFTAAGLHQVRVSVTDADGNVANATRAYRVLEPGALPYMVEAPGYATHGGATYLFGGFGDVYGTYGGTDAILRYDHATHHVRFEAARLPGLRGLATAAWGGDAFYVFGGYDADVGDGTDTIFRFDPATGEVTTLATRLPLRTGALAAAFDPTVTESCPQGCIYLFGGYDPANSEAVDAILRFDPASQTLTTMGARLHAPAWAPGAAFAQGAIYIFGGESHEGVRGDVARYDPATDTVSLLDAALPAPTVGAAVASDGARILVSGGVRPWWAPRGSDLLYDPARDELLPLAAQPGAALAFTAAALVDGTAIVFGGADEADGWSILRAPATTTPFPGPLFAYDVAHVADGVLLDQSGRGHHGTLSGPTVHETFLAFDGVDDVVTTPVTVGPHRAFTVEIAFRTTQPDMPLLSLRAPSATVQDRVLGIDESGALRFEGSHGALRGRTVVNDGAWHTARVVAGAPGTPAGLSLFVDGLLQDFTPLANSGAGSILGSWLIGEALSGGGPSRYLGDVAHVVVHDRALTNAELAPSLYGGAVLPAVHDLVEVGASERLDPTSPPAAGDLALLVDGVPVDLLAVRLRERGLTLALAAPVPFGAPLQLTYAGSALRDVQGTPVAPFVLELANLRPDPALEASDAPDLGGYTFRSSVAPGGEPFSFVDISRTGAPVGVEPNSWAVPLGFAFDFYGNEYRHVLLSPDGALSFGKELPRRICSGDAGVFPRFAGVSAFEQDLAVGFEDLRYQTVGTAPSREFVAQWTGVEPHGDGDPLTFQVRLREADGAVVLAFKDVHDPTGSLAYGCPARVGIHATNGSSGTHYRLGATDLTGVQVVFMPPAAGAAVSFTLAHEVPIVGESIALASDAGPDTAAWSWDFGDGTTSDLEAPTHAWPAPGAYVVRLRTTDALGVEREAAQRIEVVQPGLSDYPLLALSQGFAHEGAAYSIPLSLHTGYSGMGGPILRYDPARDTVVMLEAEIPIGNYLGTTIGVPGGALLFTLFAPDGGVGALYRFDAATGTVEHLQRTPGSWLLAQGTWDPQRWATCPAGCAYLAGGLLYAFDLEADEASASDFQHFGLYRWNAATGSIERVAETLPETFVYHAAGGRPGHVDLFGGLTAQGELTDAITDVQTRAPLARIAETGLDQPTWFPAVAWTGERYIFLRGFTQTESSARALWSYDPYSDELLPLGSFVHGHAAGSLVFTGGGVAALGGTDGSQSTLDRVEFFDLPPQVTSILARGSEIHLSYSEVLPAGFSPPPSAFTIERQGLAEEPTAVVVGERLVVLVLAQAIAPGEGLTLSYVPGGPQALAEHDAPASGAGEPMAFGGHPVANVAAPRLVTAPSTLPDGLAGHYVTPTSVRLEAEGDIFYCMGAGCAPELPYAAPLALPEGATTLRAVSYMAESTSDVAEATFLVDLTSPTVALAGDSGALGGDSASMTLTFSEPMDRASTLAALGGVEPWTKSWNDASTILTVSASGLAPGTHTLTLAGTALDAHGRALAAEGTPTRSVTVPQPPAPPASAPPPPPPPPPSPPGAPTGLAAQLEGARLALQWSAPAQTGGAPITAYRVYVDGLLAAETSGTTFQTTELARGRTHFVNVSAVNSAGEGPRATTSVALAPQSTLRLPATASGWHRAQPVLTFTTDPQDVTVMVDVGEGERAFDGQLRFPAGETRLRWRATANGLSEETREARVRVDDVPPTIEAASLSAATLEPGGAVEIVVRASDAHSGVASVVAQVGATQVALARADDGTYRGSAAPETGDTTVTVVAIDVAGNEARATAGTVSVAAPVEETEEEDEAPEESSEGTPSIPLPGATGGSIPLEQTSIGGGTGSAGSSDAGQPDEGVAGAPEDEASPEPEPRPAEIVFDEPVDAGAQGVVTVRVRDFPEIARLRVVLIAPDGTETLLSEGEEVTSWDTALVEDGYYTLEARLGPAPVASNTLSIQSSHAGGETLATMRVLVRNEVAPPAEAAAVVVGAVVFTAATHVALSAAATAGGSAASAGISGGASAGAGGFDPLGFAQEVAIDAGQDKLRDKTKDKAALDRRRRVRSAVAAIAGIVILGALWAFSEVEGWSLSAWLLALPLVGAAAALVTLMKYGSESALAYVTHARPRVRLWIAGILSLALSSIVFRNPFGYPAWVDETDESESRRTWKKQAARAGATIAGGAAFLVPFLAVAPFLPWTFVSVGILIALTNFATTAMPFGPLPGKDIWRWNKWAAVGVALAAFAIYVAYTAALAPMWTFWAIGLVGAAAYAGAIVHFRRSLGARPRRVPVAVAVPVKDMDAAERAREEAGAREVRRK